MSWLELLFAVAIMADNLKEPEPVEQKNKKNQEDNQEDDDEEDLIGYKPIRKYKSIQKYKP